MREEFLLDYYRQKIEQKDSFGEARKSCKKTKSNDCKSRKKEKINAPSKRKKDKFKVRKCKKRKQDEADEIVL